MLVVEDEQDLADAIAAGLRREGYAVDLAHAGDEALVKARVYPYDLICLDLHLPALSGRDVCRAIRAEPRSDGSPQPRILMLTARAGVDDRIAGLDDGADDYLVKPFELGARAARARAGLPPKRAGGTAPHRVRSHDAQPCGRVRRGGRCRPSPWPRFRLRRCADAQARGGSELERSLARSRTHVRTTG